MLNRLGALGVIALLPTLAPCQTAVANKITDSGSGGQNIANQSSHRLTVDANGNLWALLLKAGRTTLFSSADDGKTWKREAGVATTGDSAHSGLVTAPDCKTLHVGWHSRNGNTYHSLYYQAFDTVTRTFVGTPTIVQKGVSAADSRRFQAITVTPKGTIVIAMNSTGTVTAPFARWAGYLLVKKAGSSAFSAPVQVNQAFSGLRMTLQAVGEIVHATYRTASGGHNITYRAYDTEKLAFVANELWIGGPKGGDTLEITNGSGMTADDAGNLYVVYGIGDKLAGKGEIKVAFAKPPYTTWTRQIVAADPPMVGRNVSYHLSLVHTTDRQVFAVYAKSFDNHTRLYDREMKDGAFVTAERTVITTSGAYSRICGAHSRQARTGHLTLGLDTGLQEAHLVNASGRAGHATFNGVACSGSLAAAPVVELDSPPELGKTVTVRVRQAPASTVAAAFLGLTCLAMPVDLGPAGAPGCSLYYDSIATLSLATNSSGNGSLPLQVPALPIGGTVRLQVAMIASTANALGAVTTRGISLHF